ncbi:MAG: hypothetical protein HYY60_00025 [Parcubacteria group bacterium]|nr:hypothetical protein [Parcubacteria group bacterium]MBI3074914.1 hypothetical protein [Parcubacteria group bacterium]
MDRKHFKCWLWKGLWALGFVAFVVALVASNGSAGAVFGFDAAYWFWVSLILVAHSIPIKLDCHDCSVCARG